MEWWIVTACLAAVLLYLGWTYNRFVGLRQRAENAFSDIDVQLKRRWDLVPSLVATVEGYAGHERQTLQQTVAARAQAIQADRGGLTAAVAQRGLAELTLTQAVRGIFGLAEAYPDLKADAQFLKLQQTLVEIEDNVQYARRYYNAVVRDLNTLRASFPANIAAGLFRVTPWEFFQVDTDERAAPAITLADDEGPPPGR